MEWDGAARPRPLSSPLPRPRLVFIRSPSPRGTTDQDWKIWGPSLVFARHGDASV